LCNICSGLIGLVNNHCKVLFFGAKEVNPLLSSLSSSMLLFSVVKLSAVTLAGFAFYKAAALGNLINADWHLTRRFLDGGYSVTLLALILLVANNIIAILK
jgi:hypothetical protein